MYTTTHIKLLNHWGMLSSHFLMVKFKFNVEYARELMKTIVQDFENVFFINKDKICIQGRYIIPMTEKITRKRKYLMVRRIKGNIL
jgi:hypothetical protein